MRRFNLVNKETGNTVGRKVTKHINKMAEEIGKKIFDIYFIGEDEVGYYGCVGSVDLNEGVCDIDEQWVLYIESVMENYNPRNLINPDNVRDFVYFPQGYIAYGRWLYSYTLSNGNMQFWSIEAHSYHWYPLSKTNAIRCHLSPTWHMCESAYESFYLDNEDEIRDFLYKAFNGQRSHEAMLAFTRMLENRDAIKVSDNGDEVNWNNFVEIEPNRHTPDDGAYMRIANGNWIPCITIEKLIELNKTEYDYHMAGIERSYQEHLENAGSPE